MDFMESAIKEAVKGMRKGEGGPFGALIVHKKKILARAHNTVLKTHDPTAHAEVNAIRKAAKKLKRFDLSDCEIYTSCEPCPMCFSAIHWARISKIFYAATITDAKRAGFNELEISAKKMKKNGKSTVKLIKVNSCKSCKAPFKEFKKDNRKTY
jgi:guanine deaminase